MLAVLCSGPCFDLNMFSEDAEVYKLLDLLLASEDQNIYNEGQRAVVMLLEVKLFFIKENKSLDLKMNKVKTTTPLAMKNNYPQQKTHRSINVIGIL